MKNCFPSKLHYILSEMEKDGFNHIMCWQSSGRSFKIHNQQLLEKEILQKWFCQSKFASFQRQLNIYGFVRISSGADKGGYYHRMFLKDRPELASQIPREKVSKTDTKSRATTPRTARLDDANLTNEERGTTQIASHSLAQLTSPLFVSSSRWTFSSLVFSSPNNTNALSNLCADLRNRELLSLLSQGAPQMPNSVPSAVNHRIPSGLLQHSGVESTALLELLLRSEGTGTSMNGTSIVSAASEHYQNLLNSRWQQSQQHEDRP